MMPVGNTTGQSLDSQSADHLLMSTSVVGVETSVFSVALHGGADKVLGLTQHVT